MKPKHSKERLEAFSDAVFAFAATLIVVSFEVPKEFEALKDTMSGFGSFGISFLALVLIWKVHYDYYRKISIIDNVIIFINMLLLFVFLFYVYPMKFLANSLIQKSSLTSPNDFATLFSIYSFGFAFLFLLVSLLYRYSSTKENQLLLMFWANHYTIFVIVAIFSIVLAQLKVGLNIGLPVQVYILLGPLCYLHGKKFGGDII